jgi:hypothetical protein
VRRHCCVVLNGTARTTMSLIAMRSNVRAVRIYLPVIRASSPTRMKFSSSTSGSSHQQSQAPARVADGRSKFSGGRVGAYRAPATGGPASICGDRLMVRRPSLDGPLIMARGPRDARTCGPACPPLRSTPSPAVIRIGLRTGDKFPSMKVESSGGGEGGVKGPPTAWKLMWAEGSFWPGNTHRRSAAVMHFKPPLATGPPVPDHSGGRAGPGDKVPK